MHIIWILKKRVWSDYWEDLEDLALWYKLVITIVIILSVPFLICLVILSHTVDIYNFIFQPDENFVKIEEAMLRHWYSEER